MSVPFVTSQVKNGLFSFLESLLTGQRQTLLLAVFAKGNVVWYGIFKAGTALMRALNTKWMLFRRQACVLALWCLDMWINHRVCAGSVKDLYADPNLENPLFITKLKLHGGAMIYKPCEKDFQVRFFFNCLLTFHMLFYFTFNCSTTLYLLVIPTGEL